MKRNLYLLLILLSAIVISHSCVKREWYNPFDPNCPKDYWTPTNVKLIQEGNAVKLTWSEDVSNISGFKITKQVESGVAIELPSLDKSTTMLSDISLVAGKVHEYTILAYAGNNKSDEVSLKITPVFAPTVSIPVASSITSTSMVLTNTIESDGGVAITARGVCWSINQNPTTNDNKTTDGNGNGTYSSTITGLAPGTIYYIRAYATNSQGTSYSNVLGTTTNAILSSITTSVVSSIGSTSAICGGVISSDGGATVTARGVCWNTAGNPTLADNKTTDGTGTGSYTSSVTGLTPGLSYYIRAYSVNSIGTTYGNISPFTTLAVIPTLSTGSLTALTSTTASCAVTILNDGGSVITMKGVCWSTNTDPTTADSKTSDGTGTGSFVSSITGLTPEVTYYVRPYAVNSIGTAYGTVATIKTLASAPTLTTVAPVMLTSTTATCGGIITSDGGLAITARGVCWSTSHNPTLADAKTSDGTGAGNFTSSISGLTQGATYYIRAFATNSKGTTYGNEATIIASLQASITTTDPTSILSTSVQSGGNVISDGGTPVTARGLCWSTSQNPTIANQHTTDGSGAGTYISQVTGLTPNTLYYIRSFATNTAGTVYGKQISITTSYGEVTDADGNVYPTVKIGNQIWMAENLRTTKYNDGTAITNMPDQTTWGLMTTGAYCWYNNDAASNKKVYGALYNGFAVGTNKLAPVGWHIPTLDEWLTLLANSSGTENLKESGNAHWSDIGSPGTNFTGFTAAPGGIRYPDVKFDFLGISANWWTNVLSDIGYIGFAMDRFHGTGYGGYDNKWGLSIRCIQGILTVPVVSTTLGSASDIMLTSATAKGVVTDVGGPMVTSRGICWSTSNNPTILDSKTSNGSGYGSFTGQLTGLSPGTTYYYRAYAINSSGTSYGISYAFTTQFEQLVFNSNLVYGSVADIDGNVYKTITIGTQTWFAENLRTTKYKDGTAIPNLTDNVSWDSSTSGAYCYYNNNAEIKNIAGALYNWYTVATTKLCPEGWHVPSSTEMLTLANAYGGLTVAGFKLKESGTKHWKNGPGGNESGFTGVPGGLRWDIGKFIGLDIYAVWWSTLEWDQITGTVFRLQDYNGSVEKYGELKKHGCNVRCLKD